MLRSKCRYQDFGKKPKNIFFYLESRNYTSKTINKLIDEDGKEYTESNDILSLKKNFIRNYTLKMKK